MRIRAATIEDAPALGRVMVESWLSAHRGQLPDEAWQKRVDEWSPDVSARGWARVLAEQADGNAPRDVVLVAEDDSPAPHGLVYGTPADDDLSGATAEISALYVSPDHRGRGIGAMLLRAAARELATFCFTTLRVGVLTANLPARNFYEAMDGREVGRRTFDEEGYLLPVTVYAWSDISVLFGECATPLS
jgi:ribosomal protein S18 acetylase RimI-like enzyme